VKAAGRRSGRADAMREGDGAGHEQKAEKKPALTPIIRCRLILYQGDQDRPATFISNHSKTNSKSVMSRCELTENALAPPRNSGATG